MIIEKLIEIDKCTKHINNLQKQELNATELKTAQQLQNAINNNININDFMNTIDFILNS